MVSDLAIVDSSQQITNKKSIGSIRMDQLINSLPALLLAAGNAEEVTEAAALAVWNHVAGEGLRQHTAARSLQKQK